MTSSPRPRLPYRPGRDRRIACCATRRRWRRRSACPTLRTEIVKAVVQAPASPATRRSRARSRTMSSRAAHEYPRLVEFEALLLTAHWQDRAASCARRGGEGRRAEGLVVLVAGANGFIGAHRRRCAKATTSSPATIDGSCRAARGRLQRGYRSGGSSTGRLAPASGRRSTASACCKDGGGQSSEAIHHRAPARYLAASADVRRATTSRRSARTKAPVADFAASKLRGERAAPLGWAVLRPSLVYAAGSYGRRHVAAARAAGHRCARRSSATDRSRFRRSMPRTWRAPSTC